MLTVLSKYKLSYLDFWIRYWDTWIYYLDISVSQYVLFPLLIAFYAFQMLMDDQGTHAGGPADEQLHEK
jgi:hypothetical protein